MGVGLLGFDGVRDRESGGRAMNQDFGARQVKVFTSGGLTFGIRSEDGVVALAVGEDERAEALVRERLSDATESVQAISLAGSTKDEGEEVASLTLMVAQRCNLRCFYCYGGDGEYGAPGMLDDEAALKAITTFLSRDGGPRRNITFFGGEPLLALRLIQKLTARALRVAVRHDRVVSFSMTTNATLVTDRVAQWLACHPFSVVVSIDGEPNAHGRNRPDAAGNNSWEATVRGATRLLRFLGPERVKARVTLTSEYPDINRVLQALEGVGFTSVALAQIEPSYDGRIAAWTEADHMSAQG
jgi:sulfatase maturation enzyme AslB (radical SAM superfamily)